MEFIQAFLVLIIILATAILWLFGIPIALIVIAVKLSDIHKAMREPAKIPWNSDYVSLKSGKVVDADAKPVSRTGE